jgi:hypothetical protein
MTQAQIDEQIQIIREVSAEALKSKEASRKFLIDAGIIQDKPPKKKAPKKKK